MPIARRPVGAPPPPPKPGGLGAAFIGGILYAVWAAVSFVGAPLWNAIADALERFEAWLAETYQDAIDTVIRKTEGVRDSESPGGAIRAMFDPLPLLAIIPVVAGFAGAVASGAAQRFVAVAIKKPLTLWEYETNRIAQLMRLSADEGRLAERRNALALGQLADDLRDQGWSDDRITARIAAVSRWLTVGEIQDAFYRGEVDQFAAVELLRGTGLPDDQVDVLFRTFQRIPPATDLVRFVVREVYDPGLRGQQLEGIDQFPQFRADMKRQGFSDFDTASYWAAHWDLPSTSQGYEMLHRLRPGRSASPFTVDDLRALLRRNDVLPAFIEQLIEISYNPLTRVDVRRMYRDGTLDLDQVREAYLDLGYNAENAELLTQWVTKQNTGANRDLTKAEWLNAYKRRLASRDAAAAGLEDLRYGPEEVALFLAGADYDLEQQRAGRRTTVIRARFMAGLESPASAVNKLSELGKPPEEVEELITLWGEQLADRVERPTPSQLLGFYKDRVISGPDVAAELRLAGYDDRYVEWYIRQADAQIAEEEARKDDAERRRSLVRLPVPTRGDITDWIRREILTPEQGTERLLAMGYTAADVAAYLASVRLPVAIPFYGSPEGRIRTLEAKLAFSRGTIDGGELRRRLGALGYPAELADAIADFEELKAGG